MMKQVKILLIAAMAVFGATQTMNAQAKTAHVDVNEIMMKMPAVQEAQKQLEQLSGTYDTAYKTMVEEYQNKLKKYEQEASTVTEQMNEDRAKEVQDMEKIVL